MSVSTVTACGNQTLMLSAYCLQSDYEFSRKLPEQWWDSTTVISCLEIPGFSTDQLPGHSSCRQLLDCYISFYTNHINNFNAINIPFHISISLSIFSYRALPQIVCVWLCKLKGQWDFCGQMGPLLPSIIIRTQHRLSYIGNSQIALWYSPKKVYMWAKGSIQIKSVSEN